LERLINKLTMPLRGMGNNSQPGDMVYFAQLVVVSLRERQDHSRMRGPRKSLPALGGMPTAP